MAADLPFGCACGTVNGRLLGITPASGHQLQCHCDDCRRAVLWLGQPDPGPDGIRYYQTTPDRFVFTSGQDQLRALTWKNPRLLRWYAGCCNTPLFNTLDSPKWAFASLMIDRLDDPAALGPCSAHAFVLKANGKRGHEHAAGFMWGFAKRVTRARVTGSWRTTPFFDDAGVPIAPIRALTREDRAKARL